MCTLAIFKLPYTLTRIPKNLLLPYPNNEFKYLLYQIFSIMIYKKLQYYNTGIMYNINISVKHFHLDDLVTLSCGKFGLRE